MEARKRNNYLHLARVLAVADFKVRFNGSVLGYFWYLLKPLMMFGVLYAVFSVYMRFSNVQNYPLYLFIGLILWDFFASGTRMGIESLSHKRDLLCKVSFPRWIIVVAANATALITLLFNLVVLSIFMLYGGVYPEWSWLWMVALVIPLEFVVLGVSFALSSLNLAYRDVLHSWEVILQLGFWATPIIYPLSIVPEKYRFVIMLNPMARIIQGGRSILLERTIPEWTSWVLLGLVSTTILGTGYAIFRRREPRFAEEI